MYPLLLSGMSLPNGISASPDKKLIYVLFTGSRLLKVGQQQKDGSLKVVQEYSVSTLWGL